MSLCGRDGWAYKAWEKKNTMARWVKFNFEVTLWLVECWFKYQLRLHVLICPGKIRLGYGKVFYWWDPVHLDTLTNLWGYQICQVSKYPNLCPLIKKFKWVALVFCSFWVSRQWTLNLSKGTMEFPWKFFTFIFIFRIPLKVFYCYFYFYLMYCNFTRAFLGVWLPNL